MTATILTVEDERDVLELIRFHLAKAGYRILTATTGREALEVIRLQRPDLVLLDLMLPDIDGFGVCEILRRSPETAALPIVIVSAWNTADSRNLGLELGALDYLAKPFSPRCLVERVQRLLGQRDTGRSPAAASAAARAALAAPAPTTSQSEKGTSGLQLELPTSSTDSCASATCPAKSEGSSSVGG